MRTNLTAKLFTIPSDSPISALDLEKLGINASTRSKYVKSGKLLQLQRGVFSLSNASLNREKTIEFLQSELGEIHIGGRSALALHKIVHNLPVNAQIHFWGTDKRKVIPNWFNKKYPAKYTSKSPFTEDFDFAITNFDNTSIKVSSPERALFEVLDSVGTLYSVEEAKNLFDLILSPRKKVLTKLIENCKRIKVLRLLGHWSKELGIDYSDFLISTIKPYDSSKRLNVVLNDNTILSLPPL